MFFQNGPLDWRAFHGFLKDGVVLCKWVQLNYIVVPQNGSYERWSIIASVIGLHLWRYIANKLSRHICYSVLRHRMSFVNESASLLTEFLLSLPFIRVLLDQLIVISSARAPPSEGFRRFDDRLSKKNIFKFPEIECCRGIAPPHPDAASVFRKRCIFCEVPMKQLGSRLFHCRNVWLNLENQS